MGFNRRKMDDERRRAAEKKATEDARAAEAEELRYLVRSLLGAAAAGGEISTAEDPGWTRRYHSMDPAERAFGARAEVTLMSGEVIYDELAVADAHPLGARPFEREQYIGKFTDLAEGVVEAAEQQRFIDAVQRVAELKGGELGALNVRIAPEVLDKAPTIPSGIFR